MKYVFPFVNVSLSFPLVFPISVNLVSLSFHSCLGLCSSKCVFLLLSHTTVFLIVLASPGRNVYLGTMAFWLSLVIIYKHSSKDTQNWRARNDTLRVVHSQTLKKSAFLFGPASPSYKAFLYTLLLSPFSSKLIIEKSSKTSSHGSVVTANKV